MMKFFTLFFLLFSLNHLSAQQENWDVYMAQYEQKPGSIVLDMGLKQVAPIKSLPFVVITGVSFRSCDSIGMPTKREFTNLYKIADSVKNLIDRLSTNKLVGSFTYLCQRLDYFYVSDTTGIQEQLLNLYKTKFASYIPYINIREEKDWKSYLSFLYPNDATLEFMQNQKVVTALLKGGDKLTTARPVDHWLYFKSEMDRNCFITYATQKKFKIAGKEKTTDIKMPYKLHLLRTDKVDVASISKVTVELRKQAKKCNGEYDGWETIVIK